GPPPTAADAYPVTASRLVIFAIKHFLDLFLAHCIEIIRDRDLSPKEAKAFDLALRQLIERHDLDERFAGLGDDERLAFGGTIDEARQMCLRLVHVDGPH